MHADNRSKGMTYCDCEYYTVLALAVIDKLVICHDEQHGIAQEYYTETVEKLSAHVGAQSDGQIIGSKQYHTRCTIMLPIDGSERAVFMFYAYGAKRGIVAEIHASPIAAFAIPGQYVDFEREITRYQRNLRNSRDLHTVVSRSAHITQFTVNGNAQAPFLVAKIKGHITYTPPDNVRLARTV